MDQILQHFRTEPFWFAFKAASAAISLICLQQTGFFSSGLVPYTGSFHPHTPPKPPPTPPLLVVKMDVDPLRPHPDFSNVDGIYAILNDTSNVVAYEQANVTGIVINMMVTANSSTHCFPVNGTTTEGARTASLPSRMMTWLISTVTDLLEFMLQRLADLAFLHNTSMSTASMACLAVPLTVIATFVGYQGYLGVQHVRQIYKANAELASREREREVQLVHLDEAISLNLNKVALLEGRATKAEEAKERLQQQYAEALRLKAASDKEASIARDKAEATKKGQKKAQQQSAEAEQKFVTVLTTANSEKDRLSDAISTRQAIIDQIRQENAELRSDNSSLQLTIERADTANSTAVAKAQKKSIQEIDSLKKDRKDKDDKLKTQNQTTTKLRDEVRSMKDRLKELSPSSLEKLKERLLEEEHARRAAEKNTQVFEAELDRKSTEAKKIKELEEKLMEVQESQKVVEKNAADMEAQKNEKEAGYREQISSDAATMVDLKREVEKLNATAKEARRQTEELQAEIKRRGEELAAAQAEKKASEDQRKQENTDADILQRNHTRARDELQTQVDQANDKIAAQDKVLHDELEQAMTMLSSKNTAIADLETQLRDQASVINSLETQVRDQKSAIDGLETRVRDQAPESTSPNRQPSTNSEGLDEPEQQPVVRLPTPGASIGSLSNTDTDDNDIRFSIKGASRRQNSDGINDSEAAVGGTCASSSSQTSYDGSNKPDLCSNCHKFHPGECLACSRCFRVHKGDCGRRPTCRTCQKSHYWACREGIASGSPAVINPLTDATSTVTSAETSKLCEYCGKIHGDKECWKWCKACEAVHFQKDYPVKNGAPDPAPQTPATAGSTDSPDSPSHLPTSNTAQAAPQDDHPRERFPATDPMPANGPPQPLARTAMSTLLQLGLPHLQGVDTHAEEGESTISTVGSTEREEDGVGQIPSG